MTVWQIAAGETGRDYSSLCIKYDLVLIGPGDPGPYKGDPYCPEDRKQRIRAFCKGPKPGDLVLLRLGREAKAVGIIPDEKHAQYKWREEFDDVLGHDLQHTRRVIWDENALPILDDLQPVFGNYKLGLTINRVHDRRVLERADRLKSAIGPRKLRSMPTVGDVLEDEALGVGLFQAGLPNEACEDVIQTIRKIRRLAAWYRGEQCGKKRPNEHEIVAHAVVPLLLGLGWSEQLLGVEWNGIDVALFSRPPTDEQNCVAICEAKKLGSSLTRAYQQAKRYTQKYKLENCKVILTTDGQRLFLYRQEKKDWPDWPSGYVNFSRVRTSYAIPENTDAVKTIVSLIPSRIHQADL